MEDSAKLRNVLTEARLCEGLVHHILATPPQGLGIGSIADFASYFTTEVDCPFHGLNLEAKAEFDSYFNEKSDWADVHVILDDIPQFSADKIQRSRLRTARALATADCWAEVRRTGVYIQCIAQCSSSFS